MNKNDNKLKNFAHHSVVVDLTAVCESRCVLVAVVGVPAAEPAACCRGLFWSHEFPFGVALREKKKVGQRQSDSLEELTTKATKAEIRKRYVYANQTNRSH